MSACRSPSGYRANSRNTRSIPPSGPHDEGGGGAPRRQDEEPEVHGGGFDGAHHRDRHRPSAANQPLQRSRREREPSAGGHHASLAPVVLAENGFGLRGVPHRPGSARCGSAEPSSES